MPAKALPPDHIYVDTSIAIVRLFVKSQRTKVDAVCAGRTICSGLVCRQEFKRRVLGDAEYLIDLLDRRGGFEETHHYLNRLRGNPFHQRRAGNCLSFMAEISGTDDHDKTDRLRTKLRTFLLTALETFDRWIDRQARDSGCGCAELDVRVERRGKRTRYNLGGKSCKDARACGVNELIAKSPDERAAILKYLKALPNADKTEELKKTESFLDSVAGGRVASDLEPCLKVGDLTIALESAAFGAHTFYTMNWRESQHLCRPLGQTLIVRSPDGQKDDVTCDPSEPTWKKF